MGILKKRKTSDGPVRACKNCEHAVFCYSWGNYKCVKHSTRILHPDTTSCNLFEKAKTDAFDKKCQCKVCSERIQDE